MRNINKQLTHNSDHPSLMVSKLIFTPNQELESTNLQLEL